MNKFDSVFSSSLPNLCSKQNHSDSQQLKNEQEEVIKERLAKGKIENFDFIKIKKVNSVQDTIKRMRREAMGWETFFTKHMSDKDLVSNIYMVVSSLSHVRLLGPHGL